jgi:hypothetical protein
MKLSTFGAFAMSIVVSSAFLGLAACGQKKEEGGANSARVQISGTVTAPTNPGGYVAAATHLRPSSSSGSVSGFSQNVRDFLSAQADQQGIGDLDDQSVVMASYLEMGNSGQITAGPSHIDMWITDSFAADGVQGVKPFYVSMSKLLNGTFSANQFAVTFGDEMREVTIQGSYNTDVATGSVSFRNLKDYANGNLKSANPMGYFTISTCALLNCRRP